MNPATSGDCTSDSSCTSRDLTGNPKLRWGRIALSSASGPESQALPIPLEAQYYNGYNLRQTLRTVARPSREAELSLMTPPSVPRSNLTIDIGSGSNNSAGSSSNAVIFRSADLVLVSGDGNLSFSAPSDSDRGSFTVDVDLTDLPWLKYDWDLDGSHDDSPPTATGTFGVFGVTIRFCFERSLINPVCRSQKHFSTPTSAKGGCAPGDQSDAKSRDPTAD